MPNESAREETFFGFPPDQTSSGTPSEHRASGPVAKPKREPYTEPTGIFKRTKPETFDVTTPKGRAGLLAAFGKLAGIRAEFERDWLNRVEHNLRIVCESVKTMRGKPIPDDLQGAWADAREGLLKAETLRGLLAGRRPKPSLKSAYVAYELGTLEQRAIMRTFERFVREGKRHLYVWGATAVKVTEMESAILWFLDAKLKVELSELSRAVWKRSYNPTRRSYIDKALSGLKRKLSDGGIPFQWHIRGESLIRK